MSGLPDFLSFQDPAPAAEPELTQLPAEEFTATAKPDPRQARIAEVQAKAQELLDSGEVTDPNVVRKLVIAAGKRGVSLQVNVDPKQAAQAQEMAAMAERSAPPPQADPTASVSAAFDADVFGVRGAASRGTTPMAMSDSDYQNINPSEDHYVEGLDLEHGKSASNMRSLYTEPYWENPEAPASFAPGTSNRPYLHMEPSVSHLLRDERLSPQMRASVEDKGEDSAEYKRYADAVWRRVKQVHMEAGLPVMRPSYVDAEGVGQHYAKMLGSTVGPSLSLITSFDDMVALGLARQGMVAVMEDSPAVVQLRSEGIIPDAATQMKETQESHPVAGLAGSVRGMFNPQGAAARMFGAASKGAPALGPLASRLPAVGYGGLAAGGLSLGQEAVAEGGRQARSDGDLPIPLKPMARRVVGDAMTGVLAGGAAELLASGGRALMHHNRFGTGATGEMLQATERAPSMAAKGSMAARRGTGPLAGMKDTPEMAATKSKLGLRHEKAMAGKGEGTEVSSVLDDMARRKSGEMLTEMSRMRTQLDGVLKAENAAYYATAEGQRQVSATPLMKTLLDIRKRAKGELFGGGREVDKAIERLSVKVPLKTNGGRSLGTGQAPAGMELVGTDANHAYFVKRMNARELDASIGNLDRKLREYASRGGGDDPSLKVVQAELRNMYGSFRPNAATGGRAWADVKGAHHKQLNRLENNESSFGLPSVRRPEDSYQALRTLENRLKSIGADDATTYREMKDLLRERPELQRWLDEIRPASMRAGHNQGVGGHMTANPSSGGASMLTTIRPEFFRHRLFDPLASRAGMMSGSGAQAGGLASENDFGSAAMHAAKAVASSTRSAASWIRKVYKVYDEMTNEEER